MIGSAVHFQHLFHLLARQRGLGEHAPDRPLASRPSGCPVASTRNQRCVTSSFRKLNVFIPELSSWRPVDDSRERYPGRKALSTRGFRSTEQSETGPGWRLGATTPGPRMGVAAGYQLSLQEPPLAFTQFCCTRKSLPPRFMLALDPLAVVYVEPKFQAHLSAFSLPLLSYQALRSSSVLVSSVSCARVLTSASAAGSLLGDPLRALQSKKSMSCGIAPYFTSLPFHVK